MKDETPNSSIDMIFAEIYQLCAGELDDAIQHATRFAATELFNKLDKTDDWLRADFSLAINLLESNHEWLGRHASEGILGRLKATQEQTLPKTADALQPTIGKTDLMDRLSLVSKDDFEDWLVADMGIKFLERELSSELHEMTLVMSAVSGKQLDLKSCVLAPETLLTELKVAIDTLELPPSPQTIVYKSISRSLRPSLKSLYEKIEHLAKKFGLNLRRELVQGSNPRLTEEVVSSSSVVDKESVSGTQRVFGNINQLTPDRLELDEELGLTQAPTKFNTLKTLGRLNTSVAKGGRLDGGLPDSQASVGASTNQDVQEINSAQLVSVISQLQQVHGNVPKADRLGLRQWLETGISQSSVDAGSIGSQQSELIDVTDRFFEVIIDKIGVSGLLRNWLEKLKLTILKIVLRDDSFFSDISHPARQMLNKLARLTSNDRSGNKRLEKLLDQYIDQVVTEYDHDESAVDVIVTELDKLLERQEVAYRRNSERIARTYEGKQKIAEARSQVVQDLNKVLAGKSVPVVLLELLDKAGWRELLALVIVRDGHDSDAYQDVLNVVEQLMNWLGSDIDTIDQWAIELEIELEAPSLLEMVTKELYDVGSGGLDIVIQRLEDCLYHDVEPLLVDVEKYDWPYKKTEKDLEELHPREPGGKQQSHWHKCIVSMKIGDWLELKDKDGKSRCLRLAWSGSESFRFVFVDSQGMKDKDLALEDLVEAFKDNRAAFIDNDDVPLVDQGLHQMVQSVYEELSSQSSCDPLTGLLNRQAFERALVQSLAAAVTSHSKVVLLYIDLDKFNLTNTNYGHQAGDLLLKHVAKMVREIGQENAFCGRLGGNEFGLIIPDCDEETAVSRARNLCRKVEEVPCQWEDFRISSTVSVGLVPINLEIDSYDSVMRKAGLACDAAKAQGQNRFVVYQEQDKDQHKRDEMLQWVQRLDGDLDNLLTLRCQEIRPVDQSGSKTSHYEILLGVRHEGQILPPGMLIEAAEHFNRMARVDRWVFHNSLRWMENNEKTIQKTDGFSINLSGNSLSDDKFLEFVLGELAATTIPPELICFEITETAAITNLADACEFIRVLKQSGCKFSLDDFGSGMSSYAYIQKLPVDFIKIDGIFVRNLATNVQDQALVKSINELAHFMGIKTVAEFVESHEILSVLKTIGVDHSQGFGIKKPGLLEDLRL